MKGYKFYLEYPDAKSKRKATRKNLGNHSGNCLALFLPTLTEQWRVNRQHECASGVLMSPNSPINWGCVSPEYLIEKCKRISEQQAREIHPTLFYYLES